MANISVVLEKPISDGSKLKFRTPCESTLIEGLEVKTPSKDGIGTVIKKFVFKDAHGAELCGFGNLFVGGVLIEVLLDVTHGVAFIQNADTNSYVESVKSDIQRMEEVQKEFLKVAGESVEECERAAEAIYIGDGDMPEKALIQIDPSGSVISVDTELDETSDNLITNKAVATEFAAVYGETRRIDETVAEVSYELSAGVAANTEAIEGKADLGYGYCEPVKTYYIVPDSGQSAEEKTNEVIDSITEPLEFGTSVQVNLTHNEGGFIVFATVFKLSYEVTLVRGHTFDGNFVAKRKDYGTWSPWLWENPQMYANKEYATTERYNGKIVYVKRIDFGSLPMNNDVSVYHGIDNVEAIVDIQGIAHLQDVSNHASSLSSFADITANQSMVTIATTTDASNMTASVTIKYTKKE